MSVVLVLRHYCLSKQKSEPHQAGLNAAATIFDVIAQRLGVFFARFPDHWIRLDVDHSLCVAQSGIALHA